MATLSRRRTHLAAWLVLPTLLVVGLVAGYPLAQVLYLSFTDANLAGTVPAQFIGFENYAYLLQDVDFILSVRNTLSFTAISVTLELLLGLIVAMTLNARFRGRILLRAAVLIPWAIPTVVSAQMFAWMLHDIYGVINLLALQLGLLNEKIAWLADPTTAWAAIIAVDVWKTTPFVALLLLAGLQLIPKELYEAASIDGATRVQAFLRITLPLLRPSIVVALVFRTLDALRVFDVVFVITGGGANTDTMAVYNRRVLVDFSDAGYGSAISVAMLLIVLGFVALYMRMGGRAMHD